MRTYAAFPRRMYRQRLWRYVRGNWAVLSIGLAIFAVSGVIVTWLMHGYLLGLAHGVLALMYVGMVLLLFMVNNTGAIGQLAGAWGEEATRDLLKKAKRKKLIWTWVDGVATGSGDIDHFVITRRGGLIAIDSKWRNDVTRERLVSDAAFAVKAARRADQVLRATKVPVGVTPLVVMWGSVRSEVPADANIDGVDFVSGDKLLGWLAELDGEAVDAASAKELERRLRDFRERVRPEMRH